MLRNYLTIALRTLRKHPGYAFLNVASLAVRLRQEVVRLGSMDCQGRLWDRLLHRALLVVLSSKARGTQCRRSAALMAEVLVIRKPHLARKVVC